jgi:hypothetical protein
MKRIAMIALVLTMLPAATPAMAAKGGRPSPHGNFDVALSGALDTRCTADGTITMAGTVPGTLHADLSSDVAVGISIPWERDHDAGWGLSAGEAHDCHGVSESALEERQFGGALHLDVDESGEVTSVALLFDYYWQFRTARNGRPVQEVLETLSLKAALIDGQGTFTVTLFTKEGKNDIINNRVTVGTLEGTLTATITPAG